MKSTGPLPYTVEPLSDCRDSIKWTTYRVAQKVSCYQIIEKSY